MANKNIKRVLFPDDFVEQWRNPSSNTLNQQDSLATIHLEKKNPKRGKQERSKHRLKNDEFVSVLMNLDGGNNNKENKTKNNPKTRTVVIPTDSLLSIGALGSNKENMMMIRANNKARKNEKMSPSSSSSRTGRRKNTNQKETSSKRRPVAVNKSKEKTAKPKKTRQVSKRSREYMTKLARGTDQDGFVRNRKSLDDELNKQMKRGKSKQNRTKNESQSTLDVAHQNIGLASFCGLDQTVMMTTRSVPNNASPSSDTTNIVSPSCSILSVRNDENDDSTTNNMDLEGRQSLQGLDEQDNVNECSPVQPKNDHMIQQKKTRKVEQELDSTKTDAIVKRKSSTKRSKAKKKTAKKGKKVKSEEGIQNKRRRSLRITSVSKDDSTDDSDGSRQENETKSKNTSQNEACTTTDESKAHTPLNNDAMDTDSTIKEKEWCTSKTVTEETVVSETKPVRRSERLSTAKKDENAVKRSLEEQEIQSSKRRVSFGDGCIPKPTAMEEESSNDDVGQLRRSARSTNRPDRLGNYTEESPILSERKPKKTSSEMDQFEELLEEALEKHHKATNEAPQTPHEDDIFNATPMKASSEMDQFEELLEKSLEKHHKTTNEAPQTPYEDDIFNATPMKALFNENTFESEHRFDIPSMTHLSAAKKDEKAKKGGLEEQEIQSSKRRVSFGDGCIPNSSDMEEESTNNDVGQLRRSSRSTNRPDRLGNYTEESPILSERKPKKTSSDVSQTLRRSGRNTNQPDRFCYDSTEQYTHKTPRGSTKKKRGKDEAKSNKKQRGGEKSSILQDEQRKPPAATEDVEYDRSQWNANEIILLREAHREVDPTSSTFWEEVSDLVGLRSAVECREKWFAMVKTPIVRAPKSKTNDNNEEAPRSQYDDDIFNATPMKVLFNENTFESEHSFDIPSLSNLGLGSAIKVDRTESLPLNMPSQRGYKTYITNMRRNVLKPSKTKKTQDTMLIGGKSGKSLREKEGEGDIEINARLSPGGTLCVKTNGGDDMLDDEFMDTSFVDENDDIMNSFYP